VILVCTSITNVNQLKMCLYRVYWSGNLLFSHLVCSCEVSQTSVCTPVFLCSASHMKTIVRTIPDRSGRVFSYHLSGIWQVCGCCEMGCIRTWVMKTCHFSVVSWKLSGKTARWGNCLPSLSRREHIAFDYTYCTKGTGEILFPNGS